MLGKVGSTAGLAPSSNILVRDGPINRVNTHLPMGIEACSSAARTDWLMPGTVGGNSGLWPASPALH